MSKRKVLYGAIMAVVILLAWKSLPAAVVIVVALVLVAVYVAVILHRRNPGIWWHLRA